MKDRPVNGGVVVAIALTLILLIVIGGIGVYYLTERQQIALAMQAERARVAEAQARFQAEKRRIAAEVTVVSAGTSQKGLSTSQNEVIRATVEAVLRAQEDAWNAGELEAFMEHYWNSEALTFSSGGKTTRGWTETLNRYRERYSTLDKMGHLTLSDLEITPLGDSAALVLGNWNVERESEPLSGNFSLVVRKFDDRWMIIHDHTSSKSD